jgi:hypothetical protein
MKSYSIGTLHFRLCAPVQRILLLLVLSALFSELSSAYTIKFATGPITIGAGSADNAEADITANFGGTGTAITISLLNLQLDPKGIASAISGVEIDFANLSGAATASLTSTTASTFTINADGSITGAANVSSTAWMVQTNISDPTGGYLTNTVALCVVCKNVNGTSPPTELVVGGPATGQPAPYGYDNGNNSITNNHSPYILGSGSTFSYATGTPLAGMNSTPTWVINLPQFQATTRITAVRFYFGSAYITPAQEADATIVVTPEPGPISMVVGGLLMIVAGAWRRRQSRNRN